MTEEETIKSIFIKFLNEELFYWNEIPGGPDMWADENNKSPDDMTQHIAGLRVKRIVELKKILKAGPDE